MAFGTNNNNTEKKVKTLPKVETLIAQDTKIEGNVNSATGTIRIDGSIEGEVIKSYGIILGEQGRVKGNLFADIIIVAGEVEGNIQACEKLEIMSSAKIKGNIESPLISIAEGSLFEGSCKMINTATNIHDTPSKDNETKPKAEKKPKVEKIAESEDTEPKEADLEVVETIES